MIQSVLNRKYCDLGTIANLKFLKNTADIISDRSVAEAEAGCYFFIRIALSYEPYNAALVRLD
jgi:hypothetical protein